MNTFVSQYGPWALVTGASAGIGAEFARQLAIKKMHLVLVARRTNRLKKLAATLAGRHGVQVRIVTADLADTQFLETVCKATGDIEVGLVVNNAGFAVTGEFLDNSDQEEQDLLAVNCRAPMLLVRQYGPKMVARSRGGIIMVSSIAGFGAMPGWSHYAASKAYTLLLGEGLAHELKEFGVHVLTLCPGSTATEFHRVAHVNGGKNMDPAQVVDAALHNLGKKDVVIPGIHNQLIAASARFLSRGRNTRKGAFIVKHIRTRREK